MATEARALVEPGARGAPVLRAPRWPSCAMSARAMRSRSSCRTGALDGGGCRRRCAQTFERDYAALFERPIPGAAIEILSWSVLASDRARKLPARRAPASRASRAGKAGRAAAGSSTAGAGEVIDVPVYRREHMAPGATIAGPAIIAEDETSTFVSASFDAHIDARRLHRHGTEGGVSHEPGQAARA